MSYPAVVEEIIKVDAELEAMFSNKTIPLSLGDLIRRKRELVKHADSIWGHRSKGEDNNARS